MTGPLADRVVLVAGASSGMGKAIAVAAAGAGARVVLLARRAALLTEVAAQIGPEHTLYAAGDATDVPAVSGLVDQAIDRYGRLDIAVNCVGTNIPRRALTELTADGWRDLIHTNLDAAYVLTQAVLPAFRRQNDGLLIHMSSVAAKTPDKSGAGYQASKAGVAALAHATMQEEEVNGVRVTVLYPGLTETPLLDQRPTRPSPAELAIALQPADIAHACLAVMTLPARAHIPELVIRPARQPEST